MLEEIIKEHCDELASKHGYIVNYDIILTSDLEIDDCLLIKGGSVPIIYVNRFWVLNMFVKSLEIESLRRKKLAFIPLTSGLNRALEKVPKMTRSLSLMNVREAIVLRKDAKRWAIGIVPQIKNHFKDKYFTISYDISVTIKETTTNTSVTRNGICSFDKLDEVIDNTKVEISRSINDSEEMSELREIQELKDNLKKEEVKPYSILIKEKDGELKETYVY